MDLFVDPADSARFSWAETDTDVWLSAKLYDAVSAPASARPLGAEKFVVAEPAPPESFVWAYFVRARARRTRARSSRRTPCVPR